MSADTIEQQLTKYLTDAHSIEEQALVQMRAAPRVAGDQTLAELFREHLGETEGHERLVDERLEAHGVSASTLKDLVMKAGGAGFAVFAAAQWDTPGKLTAHAFSYEHLELASYDLLARVAERAGDGETAAVARRIRGEEEAMASRLAGMFDRAVDASLRARGGTIDENLVHYLADAHAIEAQAVRLLQKATEVAGDAELAGVYERHLEETRGHQQLLEARLTARGASPSSLKDMALSVGAHNWGMFFQAQPDTPGKLVAFAFAFEHLEIAGYELLRLVAERAGDSETVATAERIIAEERAAAATLAGEFDRAATLALEAQGVA